MEMNPAPDLPLVAKQSSRWGWKIYAVLLAGFLLLSYGYLIATGFRAINAVDFVVTMVGLVGLFGYAFRRRLLQPRLWRVWAFVLPAWDLLFNFVLDGAGEPGGGFVGVAVVLVLFIPEYVALWLYGRDWSEIEESVR